MVTNSPAENGPDHTVGADADLAELLSIAVQIVDDCADIFVHKVGAPRYKDKGEYDFATALDLYLEKRITRELFAATGITAHGEEFGGCSYDTPRVWVVDPIDGTANYSAGLPIAGVLISLIEDSTPVLAVCAIPTLGYVLSAHEGSPLFINGVPSPGLGHKSLAGELVGFGSFQVGCPAEDPAGTSGDERAAILSEITRTTSRIRMLGSAGVDTAFVAAGALAGSVIFGSHVWDNATGYVLVTAAGGIVTDLQGQPWTIESRGMLLGSPGVHGELLDIITRVRSGQC